MPVVSHSTQCAFCSRRGWHVGGARRFNDVERFGPGWCSDTLETVLVIETIRNTWLRRAALLAYLPVFVLLCAMLLLCGFVYQIAIQTLEHCCGFVWDEIQDSWRLFRGAWRGPPPIDPLANCACKKISQWATCYERCGE